MEKRNHIEKLESGKFRLLSHEGKNLGTFDTHEEAAKHEGEVEYFKEHKNDELDPTRAPIDPALLNGSSSPPKFYFARHMQPGTAAYENETILVDTDAIKKMLPTAKGMPVFVYHQSGVPQREVHEKAGGYVTRAFYNELDGWAWFEIMLVSDEAFDAVKKGWSVSNAYVPTSFSGSGTKNNVPFQREVMDGRFTHLALVPNPRYEKACIMTPDQFAQYQEENRAKLKELTNSNPSKGKQMFKFFRSKTEEVTNQADATHVEIEGKTMPIAEALELLNGKAKPKKNEAEEADEKKRAAAEAEEKENSQECLVDGIKMTVGQLKNSHRKMNEMEKKNAEESAKKKEEEEKENAAKAKKNAEEAEEEAKKKEAEKQNGKANFEMLLNANVNGNRGMTPTPGMDTLASGVARGKARYGAEAIEKK